MLGEVDNFNINGSFGAPDGSLTIFLVNQKQNFPWACVTMVVIAICLLKPINKANNKNVNIPTRFCRVCLVLFVLKKYF